MNSVAETKKLYLMIQSEENVAFSTYDLEILFDGKTIGTVSNGNYFTQLEEVSKGSHTLKIQKAGDSSISATETISVDQDMTYSCVVGHSHDTLELKNISRTDGIAGSSLIMMEVEGMKLDAAKSVLRSAGFLNVTAEAEKTILVESNWTVKAQNIKAGTTVDRNEKIVLYCEKES